MDRAAEGMLRLSGHEFKDRVVGKHLFPTSHGAKVAMCGTQLQRPGKQEISSGETDRKGERAERKRAR